jgi:phosphatidate cytidylyltransferase
MMAGVWNRELLKRVISAVTLLPFVLIAVSYGGAPYLLMLVVAGALMLFEWARLTKAQPLLARSSAIACFLLLGSGAIMFSTQTEVRDATLVAALSGLTLALLSHLLGWRDILWICLGLVYVLVPAGGLLYLRLGPDGAFWVLLTLIVVWATDIGAFFAGRIIGGPKLAPRFSPKKTWSGLFGGLTLAILAAWGGGELAAHYWRAGMADLVPPALFIVALSLISQVGDLTESALKRHFQVKDSSSLIPGHGGLLDRVDGLVFAVVAVAVYWGINYS